MTKIDAFGGGMVVQDRSLVAVQGVPSWVRSWAKRRFMNCNAGALLGLFFLTLFIFFVDEIFGAF